MHCCIIFYFSCCRLSQVQALLCEGGTTASDGILCSLGMSSCKVICLLALCLYMALLSALSFTARRLSDRMANKVVFVAIPK